MCIEGNPNSCPKPCPSVSFSLTPIEIPCSSHKEEGGISSCEEQTQPMKSLGTLDVESDNLSESDMILLKPCMVKWMKIVFIE